MNFLKRIATVLCNGASQRRPVLAAAIISLVSALPVGAEVFTKTYTTEVCDDYAYITDLLVGSGVRIHPSGYKIQPTHKDQIGVFSNLVAGVVSSFTNGVILSTGLIRGFGDDYGRADGSSLTNRSSSAWWPDDIVGYGGTDEDLDGYFDAELYDPAGIVLYIQPQNSTVNIPFFMASEEFYLGSDYADSPTLDEYVEYSDKFAFFLKELGDREDVLDINNKVKPMYSSLNMTTNTTGNSAWWNIAKLPDQIHDVEIANINQQWGSSSIMVRVSILPYFSANAASRRGRI